MDAGLQISLSLLIFDWPLCMECTEPSCMPGQHFSARAHTRQVWRRYSSLSAMMQKSCVTQSGQVFMLPDQILISEKRRRVGQEAEHAAR